jgi:membrane-associated phospholipid phosphatase
VVIEAMPGNGQGRAQPPWRPFLTALGILALVAVLGLVATSLVALHTPRGLRLDRAAMDAVSSPALTLHRLYDGLSRVGGANLTTQFLKYSLFTGPELSQQPHRFPSGHTTVALSIALAAVIVAPPAWRWTVAIGVSATASLVGVALVLGRWHHPSDVIAATFVCVLWAAAGMVVAALVRPRPCVLEGGGSVHAAALIGAALVGGLLVSWGVHPQAGLRDLGLGIISLGSIGLACAVSIGAVAHVADRHLG